ncbi:MAG: hypothetical protein GY913_06325 [Proteobacteria bacterium]|nr:hypothetical protein [Pseudomonadota bacterium]MCP4916523.1 hypothetical protein [Pseudomonadota bacterium]
MPEEGLAVPYDGGTMTAPSGLVLECEAGRFQETTWGGDYTVLCHADGDPIEVDGCSYEDGDVFGSPHWFLYATAGSTDSECPVQIAQLYGDWSGLQGDPPEE